MLIRVFHKNMFSACYIVDIHSALTFSDKDLKIESRVKIYNAKMAKLEMACELGCLKKLSISDHVAILVCFGSIISKTSPKKLAHFGQNWVTAATF